MLRSPLLGFSDFFDEVGAVKPPAPKAPARTVQSKPGKPGKPAPGKPSTPAPAGAKPPTARSYGPAKQTKTMKQHGQVLAKAKKTLLKAARGLGRAQQVLAQRPSPAVKAQAATAMKTAAVKATAAKAASARAAAAPSAVTKRAAVVARGAASKAILGAVTKMVQAKKPVAPVVAKNLSPKAKAAVAKHNAALVASRKAAQALAKNTLKAKKSVQALAKAAVNQKKIAKALRTKRGGKTAVGELMGDSVIGGEVAEALGEYYDMVGAEPDPNFPGRLTDGSPDPAFADAGGESLLSQEDLSALSEDDDTLDIINASKGMDPVPLDAATEADYKLVGGVLYNESKGRPNGFIGSYGLMTRTTDKNNGYADTVSTDGWDHYGYVWGQYEKDGPEKGIRWGKELTPNTWNYIHGSRKLHKMHGWADKVDQSEVLASVGKNAPSGPVFGPIIGNPEMADFKGLRMDAQGNLFWYPQEAPDWVTLPLKQAAMVTEAKEKAAAEDEAKQYALEQEKLRRDEAAAQAAQEAANALAESQAASETRVVEQQETAKQMQEGTAQAQQETAYQQTLIDQAREEAASEQQASQLLIEQAKAEGVTEQQAQQILLQRAQRQEQLLAETPELEAALMVQDAGLLEESAEEGGEDASDDEAGPSYDDTTAYSEPEAESDKFRHPQQDDDYEASGFEDDGGFDDSGEDFVF